MDMKNVYTVWTSSDELISDLKKGLQVSVAKGGLLWSSFLIEAIPILFFFLKMEGFWCEKATNVCLH